MTRRCSVAIMADDMHIVLEGTAAPLESETALDRVAAAYRSKYNWPVTVVEGGFEAPYAAPAAGPPPYEPYQIIPDRCLRPRHRRSHRAPPYPLALRRGTRLIGVRWPSSPSNDSPGARLREPSNGLRTKQSPSLSAR